MLFKYEYTRQTMSFIRGRRVRDRIVVGYITTHEISASFHWRSEFESCSGVVYSMQHYVIKFVGDSRQVSSFIRPSSTNKIYHHDKAAILLKVALNIDNSNPLRFTGMYYISANNNEVRYLHQSHDLHAQYISL